jgi:hypothetical protein
METKISPKTEKSMTELIECEDHAVILTAEICAK